MLSCGKVKVQESIGMKALSDTNNYDFSLPDSFSIAGLFTVSLQAILKILIRGSEVITNQRIYC